MIIFGVRTSESTASFGSFLCPCCRTSQDYRHVVHKRWFTLYFIPLIPLGRVGEQVECQGCFSRFSPGALSHVPQWDSGDEVLVASVADEWATTADSPSSGTKGAPPVLPPLKTSETSRLAITSLILGALSFTLLCACGLSLFTSLGSIVTGHLALGHIQRSSGRLTGTRLAKAGLAGGYAMLVGTILTWAFVGIRFLREPHDTAPQTAGGPQETTARTADDRLRDAEHRVLSPRSGVTATGNTDEARRLAADYARSLKLMRDMLFTEGRKRVFSLTDGEFIVHCERSPRRCLFLVHVPSYRDFDADAKEALATTAWELAQDQVRGTMESGDELAVALRGTLLYGAVLVGPVHADESSTPASTRAERDGLLAFFPDPVADVHARPTIPANTAPAASALSSQEDSAAPAPSPAPSSLGGLPGSMPPGFPTEYPAYPPHSPAEVPPYPPSYPGPFPPVPPNGRPALPPQARRTERRPPQPAATRTPERGRGAADEDALIQLPNVVCQFPDLGWPVESLAFAPNSPWLAVGKLDAVLLMMDISSGRRVHTEARRDELGQIQCVAFSPDGRQLFAGGYRGAVLAWDVGDGGELQSARVLHGHEKPVTCLATSAAARFLLTGSAAGELQWQPYDRTSSNPRVLAAFDRPVLALNLPSSGMEASATDGDRLVEFDLQSGAILRTVTLGGRSARAAAFSHDGTRLAISLGREIQVWDTRSGVALTHTTENREIQWSLAFTPDDQRVVSGGRGTVAVWDLDEARPSVRIDLGSILYIQSLAVAVNRADGQEGFLLAVIPSAAGQTLTVARLP